MHTDEKSPPGTGGLRLVVVYLQEILDGGVVAGSDWAGPADSVFVDLAFVVDLLEDFLFSFEEG